MLGDFFLSTSVIVMNVQDSWEPWKVIEVMFTPSFQSHFFYRSNYIPIDATERESSFDVPGEIFL